MYNTTDAVQLSYEMDYVQAAITTMYSRNLEEFHLQNTLTDQGHVPLTIFPSQFKFYENFINLFSSQF